MNMIYFLMKKPSYLFLVKYSQVLALVCLFSTILVYSAVTYHARVQTTAPSVLIKKLLGRMISGKFPTVLMVSYLYNIAYHSNSEFPSCQGFVYGGR